MGYFFFDKWTFLIFFYFFSSVTFYSLRTSILFAVTFLLPIILFHCCTKEMCASKIGCWASCQHCRDFQSNMHTWLKCFLWIGEYFYLIISVLGFVLYGGRWSQLLWVNYRMSNDVLSNGTCLPLGSKLISPIKRWV